jgi:hypothetical protein
MTDAPDVMTAGHYEAFLARDTDRMLASRLPSPNAPLASLAVFTILDGKIIEIMRLAYCA